MPEDILFQFKATDQTGDAFSAIERRIQGLTRQATQVGTELGRGLGGATLGAEAAGAFRELQAETQAYAEALAFLGQTEDRVAEGNEGLAHAIQAETQARVQQQLTNRAAARALELTAAAAEHYSDIQRRNIPINRELSHEYDVSADGLDRLLKRLREQLPIQRQVGHEYETSSTGLNRYEERLKAQIPIQQAIRHLLDESAEGLERERRTLERRAQLQEELNRGQRDATRGLRGWIATLQAAGHLRGAGTAIQDVIDRWEVANTRWDKTQALLPLVSGSVLNLSDDLIRLARRGMETALRDSIELESSLVRLETQLGLTGAEADRLESEVRDLALESGRLAKDLADAAFFIQSTGLRGAEASELLDITARGAAVGLGREADVARLTSAAINAYGAANLSAAEAGEVLIDTVREGALEAGDLSSAFGRLLAPASELGIEFEELGAAIAFYTRLGVSAPEAVTALRSTFEGILKPSTQARNILSRIGLSVEDLQRRVGENGLLSTLRLVREELGNDITALTGFLGRQEAVGLVLALTGERAQEAEDVLASLRGETGDLDAAFDRVSDTTEFRLNRSLAHMRELGLEVGDAVLPLVNRGLDVFSGALRGVLGGPGSLAEAEDVTRSIVDEFERWVSLGTGDEASRYKAERELLRLIHDDATPGNAQAIYEVLLRIAQLSGSGDAPRFGEELIGAQAEALREAGDDLDYWETRLRRVLEGHYSESIRQSRRDDVAEALGVFQLEADALLATLELQGISLETATDNWAEFSAAAREAGVTEEALTLLFERRFQLQREGINALIEESRRVRETYGDWQNYGYILGEASTKTKELVADQSRLDEILAKVTTDTPASELRDLEDAYIAAGGAAADFARHVASLQDALNLFDTQKLQREMYAAAAAAQYNQFILTGERGPGLLPLPGSPGIDALIQSFAGGDYVQGSDILAAFTSRPGGRDRGGSGSGSRSRSREPSDAEQRATARDLLNARIDASIAALAREQGVLARTKREYTDFWTDARREAQYAIQDQTDALSRLERDALQALEGIEGDARKLRELELRERLEDRKDALQAERKEEERRAAAALEAAQDIEDSLRDEAEAAARAAKEAEEKVEEVVTKAEEGLDRVTQAVTGTSAAVTGGGEDGDGGLVGALNELNETEVEISVTTDLDEWAEQILEGLTPQPIHVPIIIDAPVGPDGEPIDAAAGGGPFGYGLQHVEGNTVHNPLILDSSADAAAGGGPMGYGLGDGRGGVTVVVNTGGRNANAAREPATRDDTEQQSYTGSKRATRQPSTAALQALYTGSVN